MSASPPPMMEDDDLDEDLSYEDDLDLSDVPDFVPGDIDQDDDDDGDDGEEEEEDVNGDFDVTGMSSKLHTIPKAAIHLAPKDVRIPPTEPKVRPDVDEVEMTNGDDPSELPDSLNPKTVERPEFSDSAPNSEFGTKSESPSLPENAASLNLSDQDDLNSRDEAGLTLNSIESESKPVTDSVDDGFASFGDFASAFPTESSVGGSQPIENPPADSQAEPPVDEVPDDPSFEADDDDDDEFGEFTDFSEPPTIPNESCLSEEPSLDSMQCILSSLQPMISQVISRLFESSDEDESVIEAVEPLNFSKDHVDDEIWEQICDIQSTPALTLSWTKSKSHSGWLQSVRIDPNNMVFETRHRLRGSSPSVPAFATGMGLLEPIRVSNPDNQTLKAVTTPDSLEPSNSEHQTRATEIPPVQFDWQTSGLTNPLESGGKSVSFIESLYDPPLVPTRQLVSVNCPDAESPPTMLTFPN
ncbi:aftiphilin-like [Tigriopus californicus]|uniref:aftiphilin-like n=1 Tax=Tigriopus californicus TaxID=6832 RepID=UPI0027DA0289|nr:aftiphilin-like [Tigriopus californicus]